MPRKDWPGRLCIPSFDPIGRFEATDGLGRPWDTSGSLPADVGDTLRFRNAAELSVALSSHPQVASCVAKRLFRWTFGRFEAPEDTPLIETLTAASIQSRGALRPLLEVLVQSEAFTQVRREN